MTKSHAILYFLSSLQKLDFILVGVEFCDRLQESV